MFLLSKVEKLYKDFAQEVYKPNKLDGKTKELISLACSVMADCVPCITHHHKKAKGYGATKEEIEEAMAITMTISAGSKKTKYKKLLDELEK